MSVWATNAVFASSKQRGAKLIIMLALANYADEDGLSFPSVGTLAEKCRLTQDYTRCLLSEMRTEGELEITCRKSDAGGNRSNLYRITLLGATKAEVEQAKFRRGDPESFGGGTPKDSPPESSLESSPIPPLQSPPSSVPVKESTSRKQRDLYASPFNTVPVMVDCDPDYNKPESTPPLQENVSPHQRMVQAICTVCVLDAKLYAPDGHQEAGGKIGSIAKHLLHAGYTPEWIEKAFGHGGWWYYQHARGKGGQPPLPEMLWMNVQKAREALGA
jgi:hypothetical protein